MPEYCDTGSKEGKVMLEYLSIVILKYEARFGGKEKDEDASSKLLYAKAETNCCVERRQEWKVERKHRKARNPNSANNSECEPHFAKTPIPKFQINFH